MIGKFILKAVVAPFVSTVAAKAGEAVGDLLAWKINPPDPVREEEAPSPDVDPEREED